MLGTYLVHPSLLSMHQGISYQCFGLFMLTIHRFKCSNLYYALRFLKFPETDMYKYVLLYLLRRSFLTISREWVSVDILENNLMWRNTKESVVNEYSVPTAVQDLIQLEATPFEQALYGYLRSKSKTGSQSILYPIISFSFLIFLVYFPCILFLSPRL